MVWGFQFLGFVFGVLGSGFRFLGFAFGFEVSGFCVLSFAVRCFRFWVSGFSGFGVSRKGFVVFGVRGFAFRVF